MVTNVTSLLKTVKAVEDEHSRGTRALEATIEAIAQEIRAFDSAETPRTKAEPEDLIRATRPITIATAKAVSAGQSCKQEDVIVAANMGRKAISDMLISCKVKSTLYLHTNRHFHQTILNLGRRVQFEKVRLEEEFPAIRPRGRCPIQRAVAVGHVQLAQGPDGRDQGQPGQRLEEDRPVRDRLGCGGRGSQSKDE